MWDLTTHTCHNTAQKQEVIQNLGGMIDGQ
ncbi:hypothetical protein A2U01_0100919, partial [Trifolium medium]|nr:hypothetical protein [Trifolium medium]